MYEKRWKTLIKEMENAPTAPMEQLQKEAAEFEKMMLERRRLAQEESDGKY